MFLFAEGKAKTARRGREKFPSEDLLVAKSLLRQKNGFLGGSRGRAQIKNVKNKKDRKRGVRNRSQFQDMATRVEELERIKNDIFHMAVHDLKGPLSALQSSLDILSRSQEIQREHSGILQAAKSSARRLFQMTERMLLMAKMESGKFTLEIAPVDLREILRRCLSEVKTSAEVRGVSLLPEAANSPLAVQADGHILERVVLNLLTNALRHTPSGGKVSLGCERKDGMAHLFVSDTGTGVAPKDKERIFEAYEGGGTGLGLAFCKMAVEKHGGKIWVEPVADDRGCRFVFSLPTGQAGLPESPIAPPS